MGWFGGENYGLPTSWCPNYCHKCSTHHTTCAEAGCPFYSVVGAALSDTTYLRSTLRFRGTQSPLRYYIQWQRSGHHITAALPSALCLHRDNIVYSSPPNPNKRIHRHNTKSIHSFPSLWSAQEHTKFHSTHHSCQSYNFQQKLNEDIMSQTTFGLITTKLSKANFGHRNNRTKMHIIAL